MTARSPTMVTLHDSRFVECRWWNDGWTVKTVVTWRSPASMIAAPDVAPFEKLQRHRFCTLADTPPRTLEGRENLDDAMSAPEKVVL